PRRSSDLWLVPHGVGNTRGGRPDQFGWLPHDRPRLTARSAAPSGQPQMAALVGNLVARLVREVFLRLVVMLPIRHRAVDRKVQMPPTVVISASIPKTLISRSGVKTSCGVPDFTSTPSSSSTIWS